MYFLSVSLVFVPPRKEEEKEEIQYWTYLFLLNSVLFVVFSFCLSFFICIFLSYLSLSFSLPLSLSLSLSLSFCLYANARAQSIYFSVARGEENFLSPSVVLREVFKRWLNPESSSGKFFFF